MNLVIIRKFFRVRPKARKMIYIVWNRYYFRLIGIKYGKNLKVYDALYFNGRGAVKIGDDFEFSSDNNHNPICRISEVLFLYPEKNQE